MPEPDDLATVGKPLYRLIDTRSARLEVRLPAEVLEQVAPGTEVVISHRDQDLVLRADRIFPSLDERSLGRLEIDVPHLPFGVPPGALVRARVITAVVDDTLLVPADALAPTEDPHRGRVLKVEPGEPPRVQVIPVSITLRTAGGVAVAGELSLGDHLVTALLRLRDGDPLRIAGDGK